MIGLCMKFVNIIGVVKDAKYSEAKELEMLCALKELECEAESLATIARKRNDHFAARGFTNFAECVRSFERTVRQNPLEQ